MRPSRLNRPWRSTTSGVRGVVRLAPSPAIVANASRNSQPPQAEVLDRREALGLLTMRGVVVALRSRANPESELPAPSCTTARQIPPPRSGGGGPCEAWWRGPAQYDGIAHERLVNPSGGGPFHRATRGPPPPRRGGGIRRHRRADYAFALSAPCGRPKSGIGVSWPAAMMPRRMSRVRVKSLNSASPSPQRMER